MSYLIILQTVDEETLQIIANDEYKMMSVLKKALSIDNKIISVNAVENMIIDSEFLENTDDLNLGKEE